MAWSSLLLDPRHRRHPGGQAHARLACSSSSHGRFVVSPGLNLTSRSVSHLRPFLGFHRAELYKLFAVSVEWRSLAAIIPTSDFDFGSLQSWHDAFAQTAGICFSSVLTPPSRSLLPRDCELPRAMFVDAAKSSDFTSSCFGVFVHGAWASVPVPPPCCWPVRLLSRWFASTLVVHELARDVHRPSSLCAQHHDTTRSLLASCSWRVPTSPRS